MKRDEAPTAERPFQRDMSAPSEKRTFEVGRPDHGTRLDLFLRAQLPWATRERLRGAIRAGRVAIEPWKDPQGADAGVPRAGSKLRRGQRVVFEIDAAFVQAGETRPGDAEGIAVVYEDDVLVAVSKPSAVSVYPSRRHRAGSLVELLHHRHATEGLRGQPPSPCHRLDRETSGLLLLAKERGARAEVGRQFEARTLEKAYLAWVRGVPAGDSGRIDVRLGPDTHSEVEVRRAPATEGEGQHAVTQWRLREAAADRALVELRPETGRQHQLRAHLAAIGHPILGDRLYLGGDEVFLAGLRGDLTAEQTRALGARRLALHSWRLALRHPVSGQRLELEAPPGPDFGPSP